MYYKLEKVIIDILGLVKVILKVVIRYYNISNFVIKN